MNTLTTFDIPTLNRNFIGIDRLLDRMLVNGQTSEGYPPYNVVKLDDDNFEIELAVAGFGKKDIEVTVHNGVLTVEGSTDAGESNREYLHKGISSRKFRRTFNLADHVEVKDATVQDGILSIVLERHVPEELKPRQIPVKFV
jgi:molecular chaperone IbpA